MARLIGLQAGHQNITSNPDPVLASETGAPGEEPFNVAVRDELSTILQKYGFQVQLDDANANINPNTTGKDFAFYLAIHAEGAPQGGNVVAPDPSVDAVNERSQQIVSAIKSTYFADTGIADNGQVTNNETFYYMWNALSANTPCGIIECGDLADPHDSVILADHRRVALGIAHGICNFFGVAWHGDQGTTPTPPEPPCIPQTEVDAHYYKKSDVDASMHLITQALELADGSAVSDVVTKILFYKNKPPQVVVKTVPTPAPVPQTDRPSTPINAVPSLATQTNSPSNQSNTTSQDGIRGMLKTVLQFVRSLLG